MTHSVVYLNGNFLLEEEAFIPINDRGFLFGEGFFTTIKVDAGQPEFLEDHLQKLIEDCAKTGIVYHPVAQGVIQRLIEANGANKGIWRLKIIVTSSQFLVTLKPYSGHTSPCKLITYPEPVNSPVGRFKSLSYMDRLLMANYALKEGFDDVLVKNSEDQILETSVANVFWKDGNNVYFPDPSLCLYQGITLMRVLKKIERKGIQALPTKSRLDEISDQAQFFLCNSLKGVVPVIQINERIFSRDPEFEMVV